MLDTRFPGLANRSLTLREHVQRMMETGPVDYLRSRIQRRLDLRRYAQTLREAQQRVENGSATEAVPLELRERQLLDAFVQAGEAYRRAGRGRAPLWRSARYRVSTRISSPAPWPTTWRRFWRRS